MGRRLRLASREFGPEFLDVLVPLFHPPTRILETR